MNLFRKVIKFIGPLLLVVIVANFIRLDELVSIFSNVSFQHLAFACVFGIFMFLGKIYRIYLLLKKSKIKIEFIHLMKIYTYSFFMGSISNVIISDVANAGFLMFDRENKVRISNIFILNRIADIFFIATIFFICLYINYQVIHNYLAVQYEKIPLLIFLGMCIFLIPLVFFRSKMKPFIRDFMTMTKQMLPEAFVCTLFIYFCWIMAAIYDLMALSIDVPVSVLLMSYASGMIISTIPISIAGIGTRDMLLIFIMSLVNVSPEGAIGLSTIGFLFRPFVAILLIYFVSIIGGRLKRQKLQ